MRQFLTLIRHRAARAYAAAALIAVVFVASALAGVWVFRWAASPEASAWRLIISDRWAIGSIRLALVALGLYATVSVGALIASGRWIRALSTSGFEVDDPRSVDERLEEFQERYREMLQERNEAYLLLREHLNG